MKTTSGVLRVLCGLIDTIVIMFPIQFIMMAVFGASVRQADLLFQFLFAVYGVLFIEYMEGRTPGKFFGRIKVVDQTGDKPALLYVGIRELMKSLYFIPYIGWTLGVVSAFMIFFGKGKAIHDYVGNTKVVFVWAKEDENGNGI